MGAKRIKVKKTKKKQQSNKNTGLIIYSIVLSVTIAALALTIATYINYKQTISDIDFTEKVEANTESEIHTVEEIIANSDKYLGTEVKVEGYMCVEVSEETGLAWICSKKETSQADALSIRLENTESFGYSPKALLATGTLVKHSDGNSYGLCLENAKLYSYAGQDTAKQEYNDLIDANIVQIISHALMYEDDTDVNDKLSEIVEIACKYGDEDFEATMISIQSLASSKSTLDQETFETKAEQLWNEAMYQLLDREIK